MRTPNPISSFLRGTAPLVSGLVFLAFGSATLHAMPASQGRDLGTVERFTLAPIDNSLLEAAARSRAASKLATPWEFASSNPVELDARSVGTWEEQGDTAIWRLRIQSPTAVNLNLAFGRFDLPDTARVWVYRPDMSLVQGPYTNRDRSPKGRYWTPIVPGNEIVAELMVPKEDAAEVQLRIDSVQHGFRSLESRSGSCNNDVVCPEGDPWRDQIRSVARYSISGESLCSGQLVNNTALDDRPLFLSAFHCGVDASNDDSVVVYWNFESPTCGQQGGGSLAQSQSGATFLAGESATDFLLLELLEAPDPSFDVFFTGWDVSGVAPGGAVGIHHPSGDEKAITFNDDPLTISELFGPDVETHWEVDDWEDGTTEGGSSGSCLWDPDSGLCVGVLTGGFASCSVIDLDVYGRLSVAWEDAGSAATEQLRPWLDPAGSGGTMLAGKDPGGPSTSTCTPSTTAMCLQDDRFQVEVDWTDFSGGMGSGSVVPGGSADSGLFWFFDPDNWEMLVKVIDGCNANNHYWVFSAATTNVEYTLRVTDTETDTVVTYTNPLGAAAVALTDTGAFATCP